jgi:hypothetical protein
MQDHIPVQPKNSFRVVLEVFKAEKRLDNILLQFLREQDENIDLKNISRTEFKDLFKDGKVMIKGQKARTSSAVAKGVTYVDILLK